MLLAQSILFCIRLFYYDSIYHRQDWQSEMKHIFCFSSVDALGRLIIVAMLSINSVESSVADDLFVV